MSSTEAARQPEPSQILFQMLTGAWIAQAISVVATLGIADLLADGPKDARQLALATSTDADSLYRVMRALASSGVFLEREDKRFELTPVSECLRSDTPNSFRNAARMFGLPLFWRSWGEALQCVKTGETGLKRAFGLANPFSYFAEHSEDGDIFNNAMTEMSRDVGRPSPRRTTSANSARSWTPAEDTEVCLRRSCGGIPDLAGCSSTSRTW